MVISLLWFFMTIWQLKLSQAPLASTQGLGLVKSGCGSFARVLLAFRVLAGRFARTAWR